MKSLIKVEIARRQQLKKIIAFLKTKEKKIFETTGLVYMVKEDYADIRKFTPNQIYDSYYRIKGALEYLIKCNENTTLLNSHCCPFCTINNRSSCADTEACTYGGRHGCCYEKDSTFQTIINKCKILKVDFTVNEMKVILKKFII